jgi:hypothetical protein
MKHFMALLTTAVLLLCAFNPAAKAVTRESIPSSAVRSTTAPAPTNAVFHANPDAAVVKNDIHKAGFLGICWSREAQQHHGEGVTFDLGLTDTEEDCYDRAKDCRLEGVTKPWFHDHKWRFRCTGF